MGVEDNKFQIANLNTNTSFFAWYTKENDEIISKLNRSTLYDVDISGSKTQGISAEVGTTSAGPTAGFIRLGIAADIPHGLTAQGNLLVTGSISFIHTATAATAGITGKFVCTDYAGGITLSSATGGITTEPFHKNESIGIVKSVYGNSVEIVNSGLYAGFTGLTAGQAYYLDPETMGGFTYNAPSVAGQTKKRLFVSTSTTEGIIELGDSTTVSA